MSDTAEVPLAAANYDNNNEANASKMKHQQHRCSTTELHRTQFSKHKRNSLCGGRAHLNHLWSVWYGFFGTFLQAYTAVKCTKRFLRYSVLPWTSTTAIWELHACLLVTGFAVLLLPVFLASAVFKVGNHANDGFKLGRTSSICDKDPPSSLLGPKCSLWRHGGPTAAFLHLVIAFSLLVPKLVMEARLVEAGFLPSDTIWRTDLDFMVVHHDRLVVLSFMTAAAPSNSTSPTIVPSSISSSFEASTVTSLLNTTKVPQAAAISFNFIKYLKDFFSLEETDNNIDSGFGSSVSVEYLNYALALFVYSVRYPAVFWNTNKCFGIIFSIQLLANGVQSLLAFAGMSVLYKVQIIGAWKALPLLRHYPDGMSPLGGRSPFLLNPHVTLALFALSSLLVLSSSLILYLYGHGRFNSFLNQQRDRKHIFVTSSTHHHSWGYFTHCAALCVLVAVAVAYAPLLYDYTVVYRGSLDGAVLACIVASISHLFLWVLVWLFLTIKHRWTFKLRVTVGRATVRSARSVKLVTDIDLAGGRTEDSGQQPLLIVGNGRTYTVSEHSPKKAIMSVIQKAAMEKKSKASTASNSVGGSEIADEDAEEQIYWLRPALVSPQRSPDSGSEDKLCWFSSRNRKQPGQPNKHKVTFNEASSTSNIRNPKGGIPKPKLRSSGNGGVDEDDGDYATLRELPLIPSLADPEDDTTSEEGKLLACVRDDNVTYASTSRDLIPPGDYEDPSPLLTPEPLSDREETATASRLTAANVKTNPVNVTVHPQVALTQTPRCLRRADSGMPHEELTPRSDSISTESSSSPPEALGSNHSETSSGVHSNASSDHQNHPQPNDQNPQNNVHLVKPPQNHVIKQESQPAPNQYSGAPHHLPGPVNHQLTQVIASRRATSVADLAQQKEDHQWKSCSLQRNVQPPGTAAFHNMMNSVLQNGKKPDQMYGYSGPHAQNIKIDNSGYGCTNSIQQTQVQPPYGYTKAPAEAQYGFTKSIPQTQTNGYQNGDPRYGYAKSTVSTESQNHGYVNAGSTSIKDSSNYGYAKSAHSTPSHKVDPPESHHVRHNSLYGYSQITNPENVILPRNSLYGYTSTASSVTGDAETSNYSPSTSQHGLYSYTNPTPDVISPASSSIYGFTSQKSEVTEHGGIPAVILESSESTVVIRRKIPKPLVVDAQTIPVITEEPFGRSTNMKMTSFTEQSDLKNIQASSATLPLYPTQPPQLQYPHCSTMPLPHPSPSSNPQTPLTTGTSCNVYPRQHTTIPTHHNGVRLFPPFTKRAKTIQNGQPRMNGSSEILYGSSTGTK